MPRQMLVKPFMGTFMTAIFIFSTLYTLAFYYTQGADSVPSPSALPDSSSHSLNEAGSGLGAILIPVDFLLNFLSWLSPWALVKGMFLWFVGSNAPTLFQVLDLLLLRPIGWIFLFIEVNYIISKIPTISPE